jgi:K(+)-stimulated pyrophosphate-energized sodium pump
MNALYGGMIVAGVLSRSASTSSPTKSSARAHDRRHANDFGARIFGCALVGLVVTGLITYITEIYTGTTVRAGPEHRAASVTGHATNIIAGLAVSMQATALPRNRDRRRHPRLVTRFAGLYGVGIAVMSMLSMAGIVVAIDSFGPITDNAGGIAEMAEMPEDVRNVTDPLDAVGNTTKAVTKGYAIGSAGLAAVVLFASFVQELSDKCAATRRWRARRRRSSSACKIRTCSAACFVGGLLPVSVRLALDGVGRPRGGAVVEEVRRQFREMPGIMDGTQKPDYGTTVDIVTKAALKEMVLPALIPIGVPIIVVCSASFCPTTAARR